MTNFEHLFSDKEALIDLLDDETPFWNHVNGWWCEQLCPHRVNGECKYDECQDTHTTPELIEMWLNSEACDIWKED